MTNTDDVTNDTTPTFWGVAEANSIIRVYDDVNGNPADYVLLGTTVAVPDDGTNVFPGGQWNLTSTVDLNNPAYFPHDGVRHLLVTAEDLAGNVSAPDALTIFIDTQGPQISNVQINSTSSTYNLFGVKPTNALQGPTPLVNSLTISVVDNPARDTADFPNYLALLIPTPVVTITSGGSGYTSAPDRRLQRRRGNHAGHRGRGDRQRHGDGRGHHLHREAAMPRPRPSPSAAAGSPRRPRRRPSCKARATSSSRGTPMGSFPSRASSSPTIRSSTGSRPRRRSNSSFINRFPTTATR